MAVLVPAILATVVLEAWCVDVRVAEFQTGPVATTNSVLDTGMDGLPDLQQFTMLVHLHIKRFTSHIPLLSYSVENSIDEILVELVPKKKDVHLLCCGGHVAVEFQYVMTLFQWQHIALSLDLAARVLHIFHDDLYAEIRLNVSGTHMAPGQRLQVQGGGRLVVGQKLYSLDEDGGFIVLETLDGAIADYRIYDAALSPEQIRAWMRCRELGVARPPLIDLANGRLRKKGFLREYTVTLDEICGNYVPGFSIFFSEKMNFHNAHTWCRTIKGNLILPRSAEENLDYWTKFIGYKTHCSDIWTHLFWIGVRGNLTTGQWLSLADGRPIAWSNFLKVYRTVTPQFLCAAAVSHEENKWAACPCLIETCSLCSFKAPTQLRLRGLCKLSMMDHEYSFRDNGDHKLIIDGLAHIQILQANNTWVMQSRLYPSLWAEMIPDRLGAYPVGANVWEVHGDKCPYRKTTLLLTACGEGEFTCNDGSCIAKNRRCDLTIDCADQSDEMECEVVLVPDGYASKLPPPTSQELPVPLLVALNLTSIREFELVSFRISADLTLRIQWRDRRLKYSNLRASYLANEVEDLETVWTPVVQVRDGTRSSVRAETHTEALYVARNTQPLPDDDAAIKEDKVYSGDKNTLVMELEQTLTFMCYFNLKMYPFDQQLCSLNFKIQDLTSELGVLYQDGPGITFLGSRQLLEYRLVSETFANYTEKSISYIKVEFEFINLYRYYIGNIFLPSLLFVVICFTTLYFDLADFEDRIMVSLTSLLVLSTFFNQVSQTIPRTAYLKLIDVWFLALICQQFFIILALVLIETLRLRASSSAPAPPLRVSPVGGFVRTDKAFARKKPDLSLAQKTNSSMRFLFALSLVTLLVCFIPVCVYSLIASIRPE